MKKWWRYIIIALSSILISACGNQSIDKQRVENSGTTQNQKDKEQEAIILTYGYIDSKSFEDLDSGIQERIVSFNKSQSEYFIEVVKYGQDNYADGLKALNADIAAGKAPDIIEVQDEAVLKQWGIKGTIEDLYSYMDNGVGPNREDFIENILPWFEIKGKLYGLTPLFKISSLIGNPDYIQSEQVTFSQLKEWYEENQESSDIIASNILEKEYVLWRSVVPSISTFVDMETYTCDFMNPLFKELIEFTNEFDFDKDNGITNYESYAKLQEGKMILFDQGIIGGLNDYVHYREISGKSGILVGFPSVEGCSPTITSNFPFLTINSKSKYKDAAWQFISTFLDEQFLQNQDLMGANKGFPITKKGFDSMAEVKIETTKYNEKDLSHGFADGTEIIFKALPITQKDVDYIKEIIYNATPPSESYREIESIISEEIPSYWSGSKTVEQVMEIIQSRAQLYLDEMK